MIEVEAKTRRVFLFPASVSLALTYYSNFRRITPFLTHISLVHEYEDGRYRVLYSTVEMAAYEVRIFADVEMELNRPTQTLTIRPFMNTTPVKTKSSLRRMTAQGNYGSHSIFRQAGDNRCEIEYVMELSARVPRPTGLKFVPDSALSRIADNITNHRMEEIVDGFIEKSLLAFSRWHEDL